MTAVLLTILKIIGIVLLVILGIILFLLAVLLFVPVRYSVKGTVDNNITAEGKISWLCSIFRYSLFFLRTKAKYPDFAVQVLLLKRKIISEYRT